MMVETLHALGKVWLDFSHCIQVNVFLMLYASLSIISFVYGKPVRVPKSQVIRSE